MNKEQLEALKQDFHDWLLHPLTKIYLEILQKKKEEFISKANEICYTNYYKSDKKIKETTTLLFGKADGIETIMSIINDCKNNKPMIDLLFNETIEKNDSN